jgi:HEAT repeat protein
VDLLVSSLLDQEAVERDPRLQSMTSAQMSDREAETGSANQVTISDKEPMKNTKVDIKALLKRYAPQGKSKAIRLSKALDDLIRGSKAARAASIETLIKMGREAEPILVVLVKATDLQIVEAALAGLSGINSPKLIDSICEVFSSEDADFRLVALRAAQQLGDDQVRYFFEQALRDPSAKIRRRVLSYLSWCDGSWALAEVHRLCDDPDLEVKWAALEVLMSLKPIEAYERLELELPTFDPTTRRRAVRLIEQHRIPLPKELETPMRPEPDATALEAESTEPSEESFPAFILQTDEVPSPDRAGSSTLKTLQSARKRLKNMRSGADIEEAQTANEKMAV